LPPLRERDEDIRPIAERFLIKYAKRYGTAARRLSEGALERLHHHDWPGNVRELRNVIEQTALFAPSEVVSADDVQLGQGRIERRPRTRTHQDLPAPVLPAPSATEIPLPSPVSPSPPAPDLPGSRMAAPPAPPAPDAVNRTATPGNGPASQPPATLPPNALPPRAFPEPAAYEAAPPARAPTPSAPEAEVDRSGAGTDHPLVLRLPVGTRPADAERKLILLTLEAVRGNKQRAARVLGISRRGLYSKLQAYGEHVGNQEAVEAVEAPEPAESSDETPSSPPPPMIEGPEEMPRCS
jgi:DNA-binding NtrC family response regulator